jgi:hypothetical protein
MSYDKNFPKKSPVWVVTVSGGGIYSFSVGSHTSALSTCDVQPCSPAYGIPASYDVPYSFSMTVVPVPATVWLFGSALGVIGVVRRKTPQPA